MRPGEDWQEGVVACFTESLHGAMGSSSRVRADKEMIVEASWTVPDLKVFGPALLDVCEWSLNRSAIMQLSGFGISW